MVSLNSIAEGMRHICETSRDSRTQGGGEIREGAGRGSVFMWGLPGTPGRSMTLLRTPR